MRLVYSELLKIRTAPRTTLGLVLGLLGIVGIGAAATAYDADSNADSPFESELAVWDVIRVVSIAGVFTLILGILIVTWEYRHGTITQTFLASPKRDRVVGAKLGVAFTAGAVLAAVGITLGLVIASFWISIGLDGGHWELVGRIILASALWGVLGAGLGAVMQSQVGAIVTSFVWFLVAEPLLGLALDSLTDSSIADYLPGSAVDRLQSTGQVGESIDGSTPEWSYGLWVAALLSGAYAAGIAALGVVSVVRRDVP